MLKEIRTKKQETRVKKEELKNHSSYETKKEDQKRN